MQSRIKHCAGCTMGAPPRSTAKFYHDVFRVGQNVTTTKKVVNFWGTKIATPRENPGYAYKWKEGEIGSWYGVPEWLIRP